MEKKKVLIVYAHPDDETFGNAGTIAKYTKEGTAEFYLAVATKGEAGKLGNPPLTTRDQLGEYRAQELTRAAQVLGIKEIFFLNFIDGTLDTISRSEQEALTNSIGQLILQIRPDILITFPEDGISLHKDHIALHKYCMKAFEDISNQYTIPKLYFTVVPRSIYSLRGLSSQGEPDENITLKIDIQVYRQQKYQALLEYKTQVFSINKVYPNLLTTKDITKIVPFEYYKLVYKNGLPCPLNSCKESDLLESL